MYWIKLVAARPTSLSVRRFPVPRQQMVELALFAVADGLDNMGELGLWIDAVQFGGFNKGVDDSCMVDVPVTAKKQKILPPKNDILHRPF